MYHQANNIIHGIAQQWVRGPTHGNVHRENDNQPSLSSEKPKSSGQVPLEATNSLVQFYLGMEMGSKPGTSPKLDGLLENDIAFSFLETIGTHLWALENTIFICGYIYIYDT